MSKQKTRPSKAEIPCLVALLRDLGGGNKEILAGLDVVASATPEDGTQEDYRKVVQYLMSHLSNDGIANLLCDCGAGDLAFDAKHNTRDFTARAQNRPDDMGMIRRTVTLRKSKKAADELSGNT